MGREFKKASAQDFEEMLIALHCIEISSLIMSSQLVQVWGMNGLLPGGSFVSTISLQFTMSIFSVVCALGVGNTL